MGSTPSGRRSRRSRGHLPTEKTRTGELGGRKILKQEKTQQPKEEGEDDARNQEGSGFGGASGYIHLL
jgi:hypothetical protein